MFGGQRSEFSDKETFFRQSLIGNIMDCNGQIPLNIVITKCHNSEEYIKVQSNPSLDGIRFGSKATARSEATVSLRSEATVSLRKYTKL